MKPPGAAPWPGPARGLIFGQNGGMGALVGVWGGDEGRRLADRFNMGVAGLIMIGEL